MNFTIPMPKLSSESPPYRSSTPSYYLGMIFNKLDLILSFIILLSFPHRQFEIEFTISAFLAALNLLSPQMRIFNSFLVTYAYGSYFEPRPSSCSII